MKVDKSWVISFHKPSFSKPLRPGTWTVKMSYDDDIILGQVNFLVIPQALFDGKLATCDDVMSANNGPPAGLYGSDFVIEFDKSANNTKESVADYNEKAKSTGSKLEEWIDELVSKHWTYGGVCANRIAHDNNEATTQCVSKMPLCSATSWSSKSPDPKSEFGPVNSEGYIR